MSPAPPLNGSAPAAPAPVLTDAQQATLWAILDVVFRSHDGEEADEILASLPKDSFDWQKAKGESIWASMGLLEIPLLVDRNSLPVNVHHDARKVAR